MELVNGDQVGLRADLRVKGRSRLRLLAIGMIATGVFFLPAAPVFLLTRGHASTVLKSTEITAQIDGATWSWRQGFLAPEKVPPSSAR